MIFSNFFSSFQIFSFLQQKDCSPDRVRHRTLLPRQVAVLPPCSDSSDCCGIEESIAYVYHPVLFPSAGISSAGRCAGESCAVLPMLPHRYRLHSDRPSPNRKAAYAVKSGVCPHRLKCHIRSRSSGDKYFAAWRSHRPAAIPRQRHLRLSCGPKRSRCNWPASPW